MKNGSAVDILGRDMSCSDSFELPNEFGCIAASEEFLYSINDVNKEVHCLTHDGEEVARHEEPDKFIACPELAPGGLLLCLLCDDEDSTQDEIVALDAQTLQPRHRFGLSLLNYVCAMAVVGEELFVCDCGNDRLQVFSLAGEHRRSITGEWKRPLALCFVKDRLYLVEAEDIARDGEGELINPLCGRRIFVLSLQGDILQVYTHPVEGQTFTPFRICYFDGKLLAPVADARDRLIGVVALLGA